MLVYVCVLLVLMDKLRRYKTFYVSAVGINDCDWPPQAQEES